MKYMFVILGAIITAGSLCIEPIRAECGYAACPVTDPSKLNIHLIAHSHDDVGWMKTVDEYYDRYVRKIITNVVKELEKDPARRFTHVEIYYFHRWWRTQTDERRYVVRKLVSEGRLVFANGGWTVNDEGSAHYNNIIDQMTLGLKFLNDTFGACAHPKASWQIDPFGASLEMPSLYAQMGFDGHVCNRGPDPGEYIWHVSPDLNTRIFTTILHSHYSAPNGYNFEDGHSRISHRNVHAKTEKFINNARNWNNDYGNTNHVLVTMGDDFKYRTANNWFENMDKMINEAKANYPDVNLFYSSPDCYVKEVNGLNRTFDDRNVDYLSYWVGYYSNRPALKYQDRLANNILQAGKQLSVLARLDPSKTTAYLDEARNEVAILTHHDAITGTSPQATAVDYSSRLQSGYVAAKQVIRRAYSYLKSNNSEKPVIVTDVYCDSLNIINCTLTETADRVAVTTYNPIARPVTHYLRVPVTDGVYRVFDSTGVEVAAKSLLPVSDAVRLLPERKGSLGTHELVFNARLPALGFITYFIEKQNNTENDQLMDELSIEMKGKSFTLQVDGTTGALQTITLNGRKHRLNQSYKWYKSMQSKSGREDSGSYQFCPDGNARDYRQQKLISKHTLSAVHELNQQFADYIHQTVRTYEDRDYIEFDWTVGPIPMADKIGKEIVTRFESDLQTDGVFYTDSNGRQTIRRKYNPNIKGCTNSVITANWFPIYSHVFVKDENRGVQMTLLNDRTQGGSSLMNGQIELMVHRRLHNTGRGGNFKIDEPGVDGKGLVVRGRHYLYFQPIADSPKLMRSLSQSLFMGPIVSFSRYSTVADYSQKFVTSFTAIGDSLPESVHLLTLEQWSEREVLVRFEHMYETADNHELSKPVGFNLQKVLKTLSIEKVVEMNLAANELLSETKRLEWRSKHTTISYDMSDGGNDVNDMIIKLTPQQIRTFIITTNSTYNEEAKCTYSWVNASQTTIPGNAYIAGYDIDKTALTICRHKHNGDLIAGRAHKVVGCVLTSGGSEVTIKRSHEFEVLVANDVEWVPRHGTDPVPTGALVVGNKGRPNTDTYID
ncbi:unnamed protein product [Medioppia subpectinata]|uniref:Alpha-mannosidase n=1 Tax=Medioppia subpectinata TaxID=1979941 RepID=A0A7R9PUH9_9ACAR|nr:unnamed protein product [Medioppia subpectinata]CAG2101230.1 unnamed protein product [Medioppia subpectinata]